MICGNEIFKINVDTFLENLTRFSEPNKYDNIFDKLRHLKFELVATPNFNNSEKVDIIELISIIENSIEIV